MAIFHSYVCLPEGTNGCRISQPSTVGFHHPILCEVHVIADDLLAKARPEATRDVLQTLELMSIFSQEMVVKWWLNGG